MDVESWCAVEGNSNQQWTRANRRHYNDSNKSTVFNEEHSTMEGRVDWAMSNKPLDKKITTKRQFPQKHQTTFKL
ncbi:hypothetical protein EMCRGX_G032080 [Ephydatia muelleri]